MSLGFKTVCVHDPDAGEDGGHRQVRPCMVVLVTNNDPEFCDNELTPPIVENVLAAIRQKHPNTRQYTADNGSPHWLRFILYKPEYEVVEHLGGGGGGGGGKSGGGGGGEGGGGSGGENGGGGESGGGGGGEGEGGVGGGGEGEGGVGGGGGGEGGFGGGGGVGGGGAGEGEGGGERQSGGEGEGGGERQSKASRGSDQVKESGIGHTSEANRDTNKVNQGDNSRVDGHECHDQAKVVQPISPGDQ